MGRTAGYRLCISFTAALLSRPADAGARIGARGARLLLARPGAGLLGAAVCRRAGADASLARVRRLDTTTTRVVCQPDSLKRAQQSIDSAQTTGYVLRPTQGRAEDHRRRGPRAAGPEPQALQALPLRLDPGRREPVRQQRPRRDHARALHRAQVQERADARPQLRAVRDHERPRRDRARFPTSGSSTAPTTRT